MSFENSNLKVTHHFLICCNFHQLYAYFIYNPPYNMEAEQESIGLTTSHVCRLCLKEAQIELLKNLTNDFIPIIVDFFKILLDFQLPDSICERCFDALRQIASFIEKCKHSHSILKQIEEQCTEIGAVKIEILDSDIVEDENESEQIVNLMHVDDFEPLLEVNKPPLKNVCKSCGETVNSLQSHYKASKECQILQCSDRTMRFNSKALLNYHKKSQHPSKNELNESKICHSCGETVTRFIDHYKVSRKCCLRNHKCPKCNLYFSTRDDLECHQKARHWNETNRIYMCHICSKSYKYEPNLLRHIDTHKYEKRFICEKCGKGFTRKLTLKVHMNKHEAGAKSKTKTKCICDVCNKTFTSLQALKTHKVSHDENRTYECDVCKRKFPSRMWMLKHAASHDIVKSFQCQDCQKSFKKKATLQVHMRIHTDDRPFKCTECPQSFRQMAHLSYHLTVHKGEKQFGCKFCNRAFATKGNLTVHMRVHTGEKPYPCHVCDLSFRDSSGRKKHVFHKHGEDEVQFIGSGDLDQIEEICDSQK